MNFDEDKKLIWITSKDIQEQEIARKLKSQGFHIPDISKISYNINLNEITDDKISFVTIDSPYKQIIAQFNKISKTNWSLKKHNKSEYIEHFRIWFDSHYRYVKIDLGMPLYQERFRDVLRKSIIITPQHPKYIENLGILGFENNIQYKNVLREDQAKLIYQNFQEVFEICDFNLFDFTDEALDLKKKVDFVHLPN